MKYYIAFPRDLEYNVSAPTIAQHTIHNINGTIESNFEWPTPTNDVCPIVTKLLEIVAPWSQNQWIQSHYITHFLP
jgi:hypothetical protein